MAASVLTLLGTSLLPIAGWKFAWVAPHWIAGLVLTAAVAFHIVRSLIWLEPRSMLFGMRDLRNAARFVRRLFLMPGPAPEKPGKYPALQRGFHHVVAVIVLVAVGTGLVMMVKVDTPFWTRNPYLLADQIWGVIYVLHGVATLALVTMIMVHVYFAIRPEKRFMTRSMILGWITRQDYVEHHDPQAWSVADQAKQAPAQAPSRSSTARVATET